MRVLVFASNPDATIVEASQPTTPVTAALPVNAVAPAISGTVQRSSTLTATPGTWSGVANAYSYQWQRSPDGAQLDEHRRRGTSSTYTLSVADESNYLRFLVTATNADGTSGAVSSQTALVPSSPPANTVAPTFGGTAQRASVLTASQGSWSGIGNTYAYRWQRSSDVGFTNIDGATSANYTLTRADEGTSVRVVVTASNPDGTLAVASAATATVQSAPAGEHGVPAVSRAAQRASVLTATQGTWTGVGNSYALPVAAIRRRHSLDQHHGRHSIDVHARRLG